jgi:excisionase family DNA binding protein
MRKDGSIIRAYDLETVASGAMRMGVTASWLYQLIHKGQLDYYEIGGRKLVHKRDIDGLIQKRAS